MEAVIVLGLAAALVGVIAAVWFGIAAMAGVDRRAKENQGNAEAILDATFDGRPDVTFQITLSSLRFDQVVAGAKTRGYRLMAQSGADQYGMQTLMFERADNRSGE